MIVVLSPAMAYLDETKSNIDIAVIISADIEWRAVRQLVSGVNIEISPYGDFFSVTKEIGNRDRDLILFHGGWGKISAAASAQYAIDRWNPRLLINLGTCGGFEGEIEKGMIVLVDQTIVYDIIEQMGDTEAHIAHYTTQLDLSWLNQPYPEEVHQGLLVSGDRDLRPEDLGELRQRYGAIAGDWESGAIAFVAKRNSVPCLILRGVSDMVDESGGEAYEDIEVFRTSATEIMGRLLKSLPAWIEKADVFID